MSDRGKRHLVVIGGGVAGLAAAHAATARAHYVPGGLRVTLLERDAEVGGKARSLAADGYLVEGGPNGFLPEPGIDRLVSIAGLDDERVEADGAAAHRFLVRGGRPREVHPHPLRFARSGLLSPLGLARIALEPFVPAKRDGGDETVHAFARRRLGREAADRLVAPMVQGVFAGDAAQLSLPAAFPKMRQLEEEHGSLIRALRAKRKAGVEASAAGPSQRPVTFRAGLQALPNALAARAEFELRTNAAVEAVDVRLAGGWEVRVAGAEPLAADGVVLAGEPWAMAPLVRDRHPRLAELLDGIAGPPVAVVGLGYGPGEAAKVPNGYGALVPRGEGRVLGCLWESRIFPGRAPEGHALVRCMLGGALDPEVGTLDEDELGRIAREDVRRQLGIDGEPDHVRVVRWPRAIPQYVLGHRERVAEVTAYLEEVRGLFVCGSGYQGHSFGKSGASGLACGERAARKLAGFG